MTTKISGGPVDSYAALTRRPAAPAAAGGTPTAAATAAVDPIRLTSDALLLQQATGLAAASSNIDSARVARVSAELRDGSYRVDPQAIAARMMNSEWKMYG